MRLYAERDVDSFHRYCDNRSEKLDWNKDFTRCFIDKLEIVCVYVFEVISDTQKRATPFTVYGSDCKGVK